MNKADKNKWQRRSDKRKKGEEVKTKKAQGKHKVVDQIEKIK